MRAFTKFLRLYARVRATLAALPLALPDAMMRHDREIFSPARSMPATHTAVCWLMSPASAMSLSMERMPREAYCACHAAQLMA